MVLDWIKMVDGNMVWSRLALSFVSDIHKVDILLCPGYQRYNVFAMTGKMDYKYNKRNAIWVCSCWEIITANKPSVRKETSTRKKKKRRWF